MTIETSPGSRSRKLLAQAVIGELASEFASLSLSEDPDSKEARAAVIAVLDVWTGERPDALDVFLDTSEARRREYEALLFAHQVTSGDPYQQ
jgi:hypothetical protein